MIIGVTSWRAVGGTTTSLVLAAAMAARHERGAWLVECDPMGGVLAGRIPMQRHCVGGLERLAVLANSHLEPSDVADVAHPMGGLRVVSAPADPFRAHSCHGSRAGWLRVLRSLDAPVVLDVGRCSNSSCKVLNEVDAVVLVASPEVSAAVASTEWVRERGRTSPDIPGIGDIPLRVVFVDSPATVVFSRSQLQSELAEVWGGWFTWEPSPVASVLEGIAFDDRTMRRSSLLEAASTLAADLLDGGGGYR